METSVETNDICIDDVLTCTRDLTTSAGNIEAQSAIPPNPPHNIVFSGPENIL